ncbi:MAG: class I SAM-dependent methyltransferase, partial [Kofleriaceae bacterium]
MREDTPSRTAQWVAAARALGMLLPDEVRVADDPYGLAFTSTRLAALLAERGPKALAQLPGMRTWIVYMQIRTKLLDDAVRRFVEDGGDQVVLLGAGFDCRALRLPELAHSTVFEVDHPATQGHKQATLARLGVDSPAHYVTWDFETRPLDELGDALVDAGHDPERPTLTIWEGVTMYLTESAIDASLRAVAHWSAPQSLLAMTYMSKERMTRTSLTSRVLRAAVASLGEPFKWGSSPDELAPFLEERGWSVLDDISTQEAAEKLMPPDLARTVRSADSRVALAVRS